MPIIRELDRRVRRDFHDPRVYIIDEMDRVHMAHIDIHFGYAVNGVAALLAEILKELIVPGYMENAEELEKLLSYQDDENVLAKFKEINK